MTCSRNPLRDPKPRNGLSGYRYYNPELGRWPSRDPIGEDGGFLLYGFCLNSPVSRFDPKGTASKKCSGAWDEFLKNNPKYKKMIDYLKRTDSKYSCCIANFLPSDCCPAGKAGVTKKIGSFVKNGKTCEIYRITLCCENGTDYGNTIAHELVHFFDKCTIPTKCDIKTMTIDEWKTCVCEEELCAELRAFKHVGDCADFESCWELVVKLGYLKSIPFCGNLSADNLKTKLKSSCKWAPYPEPSI